MRSNFRFRGNLDLIRFTLYFEISTFFILRKRKSRGGKFKIDIYTFEAHLPLGPVVPGGPGGPAGPGAPGGPAAKLKFS